jgi:hypothetical protein
MIQISDLNTTSKEVQNESSKKTNGCNSRGYYVFSL